MPKISVILSSFNHAGFILQSVRSILSQTFSDFELLIIDDNSTDGSIDLINSFKDSRIKVFRTKGTGVSFGINLALKNCVGEWVAFQASDDFSDKRRLEVSLGLAQGKNLDAIFFQPIVVDEVGLKISDGAPQFFNFNVHDFNKSPFLELFENGNRICASSSFVRRTALADVGNFDPSLLQLQDFDLWLKMAIAGMRIEIIPDKSPINYRVHNHNLSNEKSNARTKIELDRVYIKCAQFLLGKNKDTLGLSDYKCKKIIDKSSIALIYMQSKLSFVRRLGYLYALENLSADPFCFDEFGLSVRDVWEVMNRDVL